MNSDIMTLLTAALLGLVVAIVAFLALQWKGTRDGAAISALVSGVKGEERLRLFEQSLHGGLQDVQKTITAIDKARAESLARLDALLGESQRTISLLHGTTAKLAATLSNSQARGQLGEKLADDILRAAGFVEGISYVRNQQIDQGTTRPDFTFFLPGGRTLNMDVKFPLSNYVKCVQLNGEEERLQAERQFLADVRATIRGVAGRDYVNPDQNTLAFMIVFVPNEQVFGFIQERDAAIVDDARTMNVILCSPLSLFTLLSVIRQAADSFALATDAHDVLRALAGFSTQWDKYQDAVETVGKRLDSAQRAFEELKGARTRAMNKQLARVNDVRQLRGLAVSEEESEEILPA